MVLPLIDRDGVHAMYELREFISLEKWNILGEIQTGESPNKYSLSYTVI